VQIANRKFSPSWWAVTLFVLVGGTMLLLGRWQLARAAEKISLMDGAEQARLASAVELPALNLPVVNGGDAVPPPASGQASLQRAEWCRFS